MKGYRIVIKEGGEHEDRSVYGSAGLEPTNPALNQSDINRLTGEGGLFEGKKVEEFECNYVNSETRIVNERVTS